MDKTRYQQQVAKTMGERELEDAVLEMAKALGWLSFHALPARSKDGGRWRTHQRGDVGFPDLCMVHPKTGKIAMFELKTEKGKPTAAQQSWLDALKGSCEATVASGIWRPSDLLAGTIGETLAWGTKKGSR